MAAGTIQFAAPLDLAKLEIKNFRFHNLTSDPGTPGEGQVYYNSTGGNKTIWFWNGTAWVNPLARATHSGSQTASTISDFDTAVRTSRLDQMAAPTASVSFNSQRITALSNPSADQDAATKAYVDAAIQGLSWHEPVRAATTANIATLAGGAPNTIDGVTLAANDRILVKDQTTTSQNGIYIVTTLGTGANGTWARTADADGAGDLEGGSSVYVNEGTAAGDRIYTVTSPTGDITPGTTAHTWGVISSGTGGFTVAGAGLTATGSTIDVAPGTGISVAGDVVAIDTAVVVRKFAIDSTAVTSQVVTHNLNTRDVQVEVILNSSPWNRVLTDWEATSTTTVTVYYSPAATAGQYRVVVQG